MTNFEILLPFIFKHEGVSSTNPTGLVSIPGDPGGVTNWGISQNAWSRLYHQFPGYPTSVIDLTREQASKIYEDVYYLQLFDELPLGPALICFDCQVNEGIAVKILQRSIMTDDDGIWGPKSEQALRLALRDVPKLIENLLWGRLAHYTSLAKSDTATTQRKFLVTLWIPRLIQCRAEAKTL